MIRKDLFTDRKGIHVMLDKTTHSELRKKLFDYDLTLTGIFEEFAKQFVNGTPNATRIVDGLQKRRLAGEIYKIHVPAMKKIDEMDHDALYHLIETDLEEEIKK